MLLLKATPYHEKLKSSCLVFSIISMAKHRSVAIGGNLFQKSAQQQLPDISKILRNG